MKEKTEKKEVKKIVHKKAKAPARPKPKKETTEATKKREEVVSEPKKSTKYFEAVGRRKTAVARVRLFVGESGFRINGKELEKYFPYPAFQKIVNSPLARIKPAEKFLIEVKVYGGGVSSQAEAIRHGISRALVVLDGEFKKRLKKLGFLKRDPRAKERRKYGLKKARKAPQWAKR